MSLCEHQAYPSPRGPGFHPIITSGIWEIRVLCKGSCLHPHLKGRLFVMHLSRDLRLRTKRLQVPNPRENIQETGPDLVSQC